MLFEMKNGHMKKGCRRSNFFNAPKTVMTFAIAQTDFFARTGKKRKLLADGLGLTLHGLVIEGPISYFDDAAEASALRLVLHLPSDTTLHFYAAVSLHGVCFKLQKFVLVGPSYDCFLARVVSIVTVGGRSSVVYFWLQSLVGALQMDGDGGLHANLTPNVLASQDYRLLSSVDGMITALWDYPSFSGAPEERSFTVRW